jgi:hypothetical protein
LEGVMRTRTATSGGEHERMQVMRTQAMETFKSPNVFTAHDFWTFQVPPPSAA